MKGTTCSKHPFLGSRGCWHVRGEKGGKEIKRGDTEVMGVLVVKLEGMGSCHLFILVMLLSFDNHALIL